MSHKSGVRIDTEPVGEFELTYFGHYATSVPSQTIRVRSLEDLMDIGAHIAQKVEEIHDRNKNN
jgi:hypothetical protein